MKCFFVPGEWIASPFGCASLISQARLTIYQTDLSFVLLLEINMTNTGNILLVSEAHLSL